MKIARRFVCAAIGGAFSLGGVGAWAGGVGIGTQSGSGTGNAFAGGAAAAEDASTVWYNPAGMAVLPKGANFSAALHFIKPSFKFSNVASTITYAPAGTGEGGDGGDWAAIPQGYFAMGVGQNLSLGIGVNIPFGLKTDYDAGWRGQLTALKSDLKTYNINPAAAYRINNWFSVGAGLSYQRIEAELTSFAGAAGGVTLKASDGSWGWNLGALFRPAESIRVGVAYRSAIGHKLEGDATFTVAVAGNGGIAADIKMPEAVSLSASGAVNPAWDLMGDITWTRWSNFKQLNVVRTTGAATGTRLTFLPFNWRDTTRYSIGANYKPNSTWKIRFGAAYDETPTNDVDRTARLPDQDRTWLAFGVQYKVSKAGAIDFGYAHEFIKDATVNNPVPGFTTCAAGCLNGKFSNQADIISIQYSHSF